MSRANGGIIGKPASVTSTSASGIWALNDAYLLESNAVWPITDPLRDTTLALDFTATTSLDGRIAWTRSGNGTYVNSNGLLVTAGSNGARFDHKLVNGSWANQGLLIEEARTNILPQSNDFNTGWSALAGTTNRTKNVVGPDGVANSAWTLQDTSTSGDATAIEYLVSITPSTATRYALSIFAKKGTASYFDFYVFFTGSGGSSTTRGSYLRYNFDTASLSVAGADGGGVTPELFGKQDLANGWFRFFYVLNDNNGTNNTLRYRIYPGSRDSGITGTTLFYGAQVEVASTPTSYIPTAGSSATRNADTVAMTGSNFSSWYNPAEGTILFEGDTPATTADGTGRVFYSIDANSFDNSYYLDRFASLASLFSRVVFGGVNQASPNMGSISPGTRFRTVFAYKANDVAGALNGGNAITDTSANLPTVNKLTLGNAGWSGSANHINGHVAKFYYWNTRRLDGFVKRASAQ